MIAVAVFDIHIDKKDDATINPKIIFDGPPPINRIMNSAIRL